jgi:hypothetical protein
MLFAMQPCMQRNIATRGQTQAAAGITEAAGGHKQPPPPHTHALSAARQPRCRPSAPDTDTCRNSCRRQHFTFLAKWILDSMHVPKYSPCRHTQQTPPTPHPPPTPTPHPPKQAHRPPNTTLPDNSTHLYACVAQSTPALLQHEVHTVVSGRPAPSLTSTP